MFSFVQYVNGTIAIWNQDEKKHRYDNQVILLFVSVCMCVTALFSSLHPSNVCVCGGVMSYRWSAGNMIVSCFSVSPRPGT